MKFKLSNLLYLLVFAIPFDRFKVWDILSLSNILIILMATLLVCSILQGKKVVFLKLYLVLFALLFVSIISLIRSGNDPVAARLEITLFSGVLIVVLFVSICNNIAIYEHVIVKIFQISSFVSVIAILQNTYWMITGESLVGVHYPGYYDMLGGFSVCKSCAFFTGGLILGHYLLLPVVCGIYIWPYLGKSNHSSLIKTSVTLSVIALVFSHSRGAWIPFLLFLAYLMLRRISLMNRTMRLFVVVPVVLCMVVTGLFTVYFLLNRLSPVSTYNRLGIINSSFKSIYANPFIGRGLGSTVGQHFSDDQYFMLTGMLSERTIGGSTTLDVDLGAADDRETHNTFLQVAVDLGIIGLALYLFLLYRIWKKGVISVKRSNDMILANLNKGVLIAFICSTICSCFSSIFLLKQTWVLIGLMAAGSRLHQRSSDNGTLEFKCHG